MTPDEMLLALHSIKRSLTRHAGECADCIRGVRQADHLISQIAKSASRKTLWQEQSNHNYFKTRMNGCTGYVFDQSEGNEDVYKFRYMVCKDDQIMASGFASSLTDAINKVESFHK